MKKTFDAVAFQRKVREKLGREYLRNPTEYKRKLKLKYPAAKSKKGT